LARSVLLVGLVGAGVLVLVALADVRTALHAYLAAVIGWTAIPIGCLPWLMTMHLVGGVWRAELAMPLMAGCRTLPVAGLLFLPVLLGIGAIYPWTSGGAADWTAFKTVYLSDWCFVLRTVIYFAIWIVLSVILTRSARPRRGVASAGLIIYAITASLAGVDWAMSLEPDFSSSIYGLIIIAHQLLAGLAMAIAAKVFLSATPERTKGLAALLLSTMLLWAYLHAMQYIIIWSGDLPDEIGWYVKRAEGGWGWAIWLLGLFQGAAVLIACLSARWRADPKVLGAMALTTLAMRLLEAVWLTLPAFESPAPWLSVITAIAAVVAVGGLWSAALLRALSGNEWRLFTTSEAGYG
jgi:hypothetical protein